MTAAMKATVIATALAAVALIIVGPKVGTMYGR